MYLIRIIKYIKTDIRIFDTNISFQIYVNVDFSHLCIMISYKLIKEIIETLPT